MKKLLLLLPLLLLFSFNGRLYAQETDTNNITTAKGTLAVHPIHHGTLALSWNGKTVYVDPTGSAEAFAGLNAPDIIVITHLHGDHFDPETLGALNTANTTVVVPASVAEKLSDDIGKKQVILNNGEDITIAGIPVHALPMYNLPEEGARHTKGWGNGYVLSFADKNVYISGDTEGIPEMRSLKNIDVAFVCMNLPYTMDVTQAADAVLDFKPAIVYPYHYRGQDTGIFKQLVNAGSDKIEVRLRNWYQQ